MGTLRWADLRLALLTTILVLAAYIGVVQGFNSAHWARNLAETATAFALFGSGAFGFFALMAILRRHRSARPLIEFWGAISVATAIMWPVVFTHVTVSRGLLDGLAAASTVALILWLWGTTQVSPAQPKIENAKPVVIAQPEPRESAIDRELAELKRRMRHVEPILLTSGPTRL